MRYEFTRKQKREMMTRCKVVGVARCECLWPEHSPKRPDEFIAYAAAAGTLWRCAAPLMKGRFTYDHADPTYIAAKRVTAADGQVICRECDREKYSTIDRPKIDKTRRLADREIGARRPRRSLIPGSKGTGLRRRFNRERQRWETIRVNE